MPDNQLNNSRILIVDDQESNLSLLEGLLKKQGCSNYKSLSDSRQVIPTVQEWEPDLILLDLMMPHMDGFTVMQALEPLVAQDEYLPILVLTADITAEAKQRALANGAKDFLTKPFDAAEVILRVKNLLQTRFLHLQLQNQNAILEEKVRERTAELERTHHKLESILNSAGEGIYGVDLEGRTTFMNPAALQMLGYSMEEMLGQLQHALTHHTRPDGSPYPRDECPVYVASMDGQIHHVEAEIFWRKDGSSFFVEYTSTPLWEGNEIVGAVVTFNDITRRKQAEEALRESEARYRMAASATNDIIWEWDPNSNKLMWSDNARSVFGYRPEEINADAAWWDEHIHPEDRERVVTDIFAFLQSGGTIWTDEYRFLRQNGSIAYIVDHAYVERDADGKPLRMIGAMSDITERKRAEQQLQTLVESMPDGVLMVNAEGNIILANAQTEALFGYQREELLGQPIEMLLPEHNRAIHPRHRDGYLTAPKKRSMGSGLELYTRRKDGSEFPVDISLSAMQVEDGTAAIAIVRDITERKRAEKEINYHARLLRHINDAVVATDDEFRITAWNRAAEVIYGWTSAEVMGRHVADILGFGLTDRQGAEAKELLKEKSSYRSERIHSRKNGQPVYVEENTIALMDEHGRTNGYVAVNRDITERKRAEEQIQLQVKRLKALHTIDTAISSSFDLNVTLDVVLQQVITQLDVDACAVLLFDPYLQTLEYAASQGFYSTALHHTQLKLGEGYAGRVMQERKTIHITDLAENRDHLAPYLEGESFTNYYGTPLIVKGEIRGVLEIFHRSVLADGREWLDFLETLAGEAAVAIANATLFEDLQRANAELERRVARRTAELNQSNLELKHANRAKDEFLATMSHELRTPLNSILGLSESLLEQIRGPLNERQEQALQVIASSGKHLLGLINDILDVSKVEAGKMDIYPDVVNVREICQSSLNFIKEAALKKSIRVDFQPDPSISTVFADVQRLKQILVNLLSNAVKFTPEGGKVNFDVTTNPERDQIRFSISDNGIGIAPDDLKKLFRPFMQVNSSLARQNQGTGLGLTIVYELTELHGGSVQVESEVGKGSRFIVILPWNQAIMTKENIGAAPANMEKSAEATRESEQMSDLRFKILIAEDNEANQIMLNDYLQDQGFEVSLANNGIEALAKAEETLPDLILMDIQMPEMHGLEATQRLRADPRFVSTPIIALTALAMPGDRERCLKAGANEYMSKPVGLRKLLLTIKKMLETAK